jgi:hypothetical protein
MLIDEVLRHFSDSQQYYEAGEQMAAHGYPKKP